MPVGFISKDSMEYKRKLSGLWQRRKTLRMYNYWFVHGKKHRFTDTDKILGSRCVKFWIWIFHITMDGKFSSREF